MFCYNSSGYRSKGKKHELLSPVSLNNETFYNLLSLISLSIHNKKKMFKYVFRNDVCLVLNDKNSG